MQTIMHTIVVIKGQLISKADWRTIGSPKKRTDEFVLYTVDICR